MKIKKSVVMLGWACLVTSVIEARAQTVVSRKSHSAEAIAVEIVNEKLKAMYPNTTFTHIRPSLIAGLYEVTMGKNIAYTDSHGRYFVFGHLFDMKEQVDLTAQWQQEQQANLRVEYPLSLLANAIKSVKGEGKRQLVVFSDPACPYCKKLESELAKIDNITVYTFLYPVLGEASKKMANAIWCATDKNRAWRDLMLHQLPPALTSSSEPCATTIDDNLALGSRLRISGTPTLITTDGRMLPGAASAEKINAWLGEVK